MFDVVVSCNTMSHLPFDQQEKAFTSLISSCVAGGDLIINFTINENNMLFIGSLLNQFTSVEPTYFDSIYSHKDETSGVSSHNINKKIILNEETCPMKLLHRQVLFHARHRLIEIII